MPYRNLPAGSQQTGGRQAGSQRPQGQMGQRQEQLELQKARLKAEQAQLKYQEELLIWQQRQAQRMKLSQLLGARHPRGQGRGLSQMMRGM